MDTRCPAIVVLPLLAMGDHPGNPRVQIVQPIANRRPKQRSFEEMCGSWDTADGLGRND
jgi:hypothetical protein